MPPPWARRPLRGTTRGLVLTGFQMGSGQTFFCRRAIRFHKFVIYFYTICQSSIKQNPIWKPPRCAHARARPHAPRLRPARRGQHLHRQLAAFQVSRPSGITAAGGRSVPARRDLPGAWQDPLRRPLVAAVARAPGLRHVGVYDYYYHYDKTTTTTTTTTTTNDK